MQTLVDNMYANMQRAASIMTAMQKTVNQQRRESDKPTELTDQQQATIAKNQGVHIYGASHPLYKG